MSDSVGEDDTMGVSQEELAVLDNETVEEEDILTNQSLQFGDYITLYDGNVSGFVFCNSAGSTHTGVMLRSNSTRKEPGLNNIKTAVFQVIPESKYRAQKNLRVALNKMRKKINRPKLTLDEALLNPSDEFRVLHTLSKAEVQDNELELMRREGDHVVYGQIVQLKHATSNEFIRVSDTITSSTEPNNMRIELDQNIGRSSFFKIMPRYKVRAEGERVRMGDQIVLESVRTVGQFVHTSAHPANPVSCVSENSHELNISVTPSAFTLYPHRSVDDVTTTKQVYAGDFIQLFHKEISAYLAAEGACFEEAPREDVHMRVRENDPRRPHRLQPPTSAVSFWQIEVVEDPTSGKPVEWNTRVRFKSVTTKQYLKLNTAEYLTSVSDQDDDTPGFAGFSGESIVKEVTGGEMVLTLTNNPHDPDAVFFFTSVLKEKTEVENGTYARIQHCASGHWLHASKNRDYMRRWELELAKESLNTPLHKNLVAIPWDQAPLKLATCSRNRMFDDAFIIQKVPDENAAFVAYVTGMAQVFNYFLRLRQERVLTSHEYRCFQASISEYASFLVADDKSMRMRQKLLRNLGVIELIVKCIQISVKEFSTAPQAFDKVELTKPSRGVAVEAKQLLIDCYNLLACYLGGNSRKNELYASRHISFFITQLGCGLQMETMYTELVNNNQKIVDVIDDEEINRFITLLRKDKDPCYLKFLSVLCSVDDAAIGENQENICKMLLEDDHPPVFLTEVQDSDVVISLQGPEGPWTPLTQFCQQTRKSSDPGAQKLYAFLVEQLTFFGWLCMQRCDYAIDVITSSLKYLTWEECFLCASDDRLPYPLRKIYIDLMINLFIDVGENADVLEEVKMCFRWNELSNKPNEGASNDPTTSLSGARLPFFGQLNDWLYQFLLEHQSLEANHVPLNEFIEKVLILTNTLVKFGYYTNPKDIERLMYTIKPILSGFNDRPSGDMQSDGRNMTITGSKRKNRLKTVHLDVSDRNHVAEWRGKERYERNASNKYMFAVKSAALGVMDTILNFAISVRIELFCYDYKTIVAWQGDRRDSRARQSKAGHILHFAEVDDGPTMDFPTMNTLKHMAERPEGDPSLEQTKRIRLYMDELFDRCNFVEPGWRPELSGSRKMDDDVECGQEPLVEILLDLAKYDNSRLVCKSLQLLDRIFSFTQHTFEKSVGAYLLIDGESIDLDNKMSHYMPILRRLGAGQIEDSEEEMGEFNRILAELTEACVLDRTAPNKANQHIILNHGVLNVLFDVLGVEDQPAEVISHVLRCLRALAVDNEYVQDEFFERLDKILTLETSETGWENDLANAVMEIFADNKDLSLKLSMDQIEEMMDILIHLGTSVPDMVLTLSSIVNCEELGVPLQRNQNLIMKFLMKNFDSLIASTYIDVESNEEVNRLRMELLRYNGNDQTMLNLQRYHANMVGLIAQCAEGYNRFIESTCMTLFDIDEILEVLIDDAVPSFVKCEYIRFFNFVYLETTMTKVEAGTSTLSSEPRLWQAMKRLAIKCIDPLYRDQSTPEFPLLPLDDENFAFEGYIPFLSLVVSEVFDRNLYAPAVSALRDIGKIMCGFVERCINIVFNKEHMKELSLAMINLHAADKSFVTQDLMNQVSQRISMQEASAPRTPKVKNYNTKYARENKLNELFNAYATSVKITYNGRNEIGNQIPLHVKGPDVDPEERYCEDEDEDEPLPLGPDFQYFVDLFVNYEQHGHHKLGVSVRDDVKSLITSLLASRKYSASLETKDNELQETLDVRCLQILRTILHNQMVTDQEFLQMQNTIAKYNCVLPVADMLSVPHDLVVRESLALLIKVLEGGNKLAQETFYQHFIGTREETFFHDIQGRVRRSINSLKEIRILRRDLEANRTKDNAVMGTFTLAHNLNPTIEESPEGIEMHEVKKQCDCDEELGMKDEGNIELVLRVLQYMCEGHNLKIQNYLRDQPDNIHPINLVNVAVEFLTSSLEEISPDTIELITQTVETLVEFAQGCPNNQLSIFDAKAIDSINHLLRFPGFHDATPMGEVGESHADVLPGVFDPCKVAKLHLGCANLVLAMMENSDNATQKLAKEIEQTLDIPQVFREMRVYNTMAEEVDRKVRVWEFRDEDDRDEDPVEAAEVAYALFTILVRLKDFTHVHYEDIMKYNPFLTEECTHDDLFENMEAEISSIEILRDNEVHRVHFRNKWRDTIRPDVKETMKWNVERGSPAEKFSDFMERVKTIVADIHYHSRVKELGFVTRTLLNYDYAWTNLMLLMTFIINLLVLATWQAPVSWDTPIPNYSTDSYDSLLIVFGIIHIVFTILVSVSYFVLQPLEFSQITTLFGLLGDGNEGTPKKTMGENDEHEKNEDDSSTRTMTPIFSGNSLYYILLVVFSVLGIFFNGYFYCFHLLHIVVGNDILLRVLQSVTKNGVSLLWVAALMIVVIYIYSLISFAFLRKNFNEDDGAFCQTAFQCFITSLRLGLMSGGGLGEALPAFTLSFYEPGWRTVFDLSFFIIITVIGLNVVFGIIVDSFSELRDEKYQTIELMESECFVCGLKAYEFEKFAEGGFANHVKHEHYMWDYVAFFLHLLKKDPNDYNSHEQYVFENYVENESAFFPVSHALSLKNKRNTGVEERLGNVENALHQILARMDADAELKAEEEKKKEILRSRADLLRQATIARNQG
eukprot:m.153526 g.153526  ORF g.153526 m.153526 type:complete len:2653 (+) comp13309_c1_seq5:67-8025(+)